MDVDKINVEQYIHQNVNITGYRLVNPDTQLVRTYLKKSKNRFNKGKANPLYSNNALMFDAVQVLFCGVLSSLLYNALCGSGTGQGAEQLGLLARTAPDGALMRGGDHNFVFCKYNAVVWYAGEGHLAGRVRTAEIP